MRLCICRLLELSRKPVDCVWSELVPDIGSAGWVDVSARDDGLVLGLGRDALLFEFNIVKTFSPYPMTVILKLFF